MKVHRIYKEELDDNERAYWECDCGSSGSCMTFNVDIAADRHIDYGAGDQRVDTNKPSWERMP